MHLRTHVKAEHRHKGNDEYTDGMIEHDAMVGDLLKFLDDNGLADNTIVQYSTDNAPHYNTWPDAGTVPFRSEKNSNWEGAYRVPCFVRWPGHFPAGVTLNGLFAHEDWLPTFAAIAGAPDIKEKLKAGVDLNGRHYRNYIDGYDMTAYLTGKTNSSPRNEFWYVNDDGQIVAARWGDWKVVFLENRGEAFGVWREPFIELRVPLLFNLRRDPFEKAQHNANVYNDWFLSRVFVLVPIQQLAGKFLMTMKDYPPSQSPGSFNLEKIQKQLEGGPSSAEETPTPTGSPTGKRGDTQKTQPAEPESRPSDSAANPLGDQEWRLTKLNGEPIEQAKGAGAEPPSLKFDAEKEAVSGSTGVNRLTGTYEVDENKLKFGGLATTKRAGSPELMERETEFVNALESADSWKRTGGNLEILSGDKVVAVFAQPAQ
jgi:heat shock protein HslJ